MTESHDPSHLHISADDLADPSVQQRVEQLRSAAVPDLVRAVGAPGAASSSGTRPWWRLGPITNGFAGLLGGILGALLAEVITQPDSDSSWLGDDPKIATTVWLICIALGLGTMFAGWAGIEARSGAKFGRDLGKALPFLLGGAIVGGFIAQSVYESMQESLIERALDEASTEAEFFQILLDGSHFPRGIALGIAGLFIGAAVGAARMAWRPVVNGAIGGAVGGFLGGFVFDYIGEAVDSGIVSRLVALGLTGLLIGVAAGLVEEATKQHWLEIVSGGMAGKQFILYQSRTTVGSAPGCGVTLIKDPGIAGEHAALATVGGSLQATAISGVHPLLINGIALPQQRLTDGDLLQLGSTILRYRSKSEAMPTFAPPAK